MQDAQTVPSATRIHEGLAAIANEAVPLAIGWHVAFVLAGVALVAGWRPSRSTAAALLVVPLVSVGIVAWAFDNPFNGIVFLALASALLASGSRPDGAAVKMGVPCPTLAIVIGLALIGDGIGTRRWSVLLGAAGIFYSLFGAFRLGVEIDLLLLVGAGALIARASSPIRVLP